MTGSDDYRRGDPAGDAVRWLAAGFGLGMLIGGALGILLAPKSGRETREQLREIATDVGARARTVAGDLSERAKTAAGGISERATTTYGQVSERARTTTGEATEKARKVGTKLAETATTVKDVTTRVTQAAQEGYKKTMEELKEKGKDSEPEE